MSFGESIGGGGEERFCPGQPLFCSPEVAAKNSLHLRSCFGVRFLLRRGSSRRVLGNGLLPVLGAVFWIAVFWRSVRCFSSLRERWPPFSGSALFFFFFLFFFFLLLPHPPPPFFLFLWGPARVLFPFFSCCVPQDLVDATGPAGTALCFFSLFLSPRVGRPSSFLLCSLLLLPSLFFSLSLSACIMLRYVGSGFRIAQIVRCHSANGVSHSKSHFLIVRAQNTGFHRDLCMRECVHVRAQNTGFHWRFMDARAQST